MDSSCSKELLNQLILTQAISRNSNLVFSVEQWELVRRLRNSGLTREQICQAFDDLDKMERELGSLYSNPSSAPSLANTPLFTPNIATNDPNNFAKNMQMFMNKNIDGSVSAPNASSIVNNYFASIMTPQQESKEMEEFRAKGEVIIHSEISFFVTKHDIKQSQIARMASVNQAYVSKFLRGEFFDLSENSKSLIYKWYIRFLKNPTIYLQAHNISLTTSSTNLNNDGNKMKPESNQFINVTNTPLDSQKRSRFSFKPEQVLILEKSFSENQYPDLKKREELARICNQLRPMTEKQKVTEQIITHWFQNKRKVNRKNDSHHVKSQDDSFDDASRANNNNNGNSVDYQDFIEDAQLTAFKTIMDRSNSNNLDKTNDQMF